jgi:hypothetical protein
MSYELDVLQVSTHPTYRFVVKKDSRDEDETLDESDMGSRTRQLPREPAVSSRSHIWPSRRRLCKSDCGKGDMRERQSEVYVESSCDEPGEVYSILKTVMEGV